jgi:hypothetical protein
VWNKLTFVNEKLVQFSHHPHLIQILKNVEHKRSNLEHAATIFCGIPLHMLQQISYTPVCHPQTLGIRIKAQNKFGKYIPFSQWPQNMHFHRNLTA